MKYVIGLGSGRCGTMSLAHLLAKQPQLWVTHERHPALAWDDESDPSRHLRWAPVGNVLVGDVGFYYLPHVGRIWKEFPECRFVCLKRDIESTVVSFENYLAKEIDHWRVGTQESTQLSAWDKSFPLIEAPTREEAIREYWTSYWQAEALNAAYDRFTLLPMEALNTPQGVWTILRAAGLAPEEIDRVRAKAGVHANHAGRHHKPAGATA